jgi:hypothetical protein
MATRRGWTVEEDILLYEEMHSSVRATWKEVTESMCSVTGIIRRQSAVRHRWDDYLKSIPEMPPNVQETLLAIREMAENNSKIASFLRCDVVTAKKACRIAEFWFAKRGGTMSAWSNDVVSSLLPVSSDPCSLSLACF